MYEEVTYGRFLDRLYLRIKQKFEFEFVPIVSKNLKEGFLFLKEFFTSNSLPEEMLLFYIDYFVGYVKLKPCHNVELMYNFPEHPIWEEFLLWYQKNRRQFTWTEELSEIFLLPVYDKERDIVFCRAWQDRMELARFQNVRKRLQTREGDESEDYGKD